MLTRLERAFDLAGSTRQVVTELTELAADVMDDEFSRAVYQLRVDVDHVGQRLTELLLEERVSDAGAA